MKNLFLLLLLSAMHVHAQKGDYILKLIEVDISGSITKNITVDSINSLTRRYTLETEQTKFVFTPSSAGLNFELTNKTDATIKVIWDDAAFIDIEGTSGKVMHEGIKYIDRSNSQPPTSIIKGAKISDVAIPTANVYYASGSYGGWRTSPLIFNKAGTKNESLDNKVVKLFLPIVVNTKTIEYIFTFQSNFVETPSKRKKS